DNKIIRFKTVDISMAVSIPEGLITPIIFHADRKNLVELSEEASILAKKARNGALKPEEYQGGSFTISNIGMYGISSFSAVINPPQAAILAVGAIKEKAIVKNSKIEIGNILKVTLSSDHRVIDGVDAAEFLVTLRRLLENPAALIF
ncbi:MAG: 2-oxo acid dehydrogenase subunit E2, partial [Verrucomicrobia bacterium]|nr:2-oxo acid dehydrogenase subunit E2 [Verrucomicrobiota bacterium]